MSESETLSTVQDEQSDNLCQSLDRNQVTITFLIPIHKSLPIEFPFQYKRRVILIPFKRKLPHLAFQSSKPFIKTLTRRLLRIEVNENVTSGHDMCMNRKQRILSLFKSLHAVHLRCFDEFASRIIGPAMILATHHQRIPL